MKGKGIVIETNGDKAKVRVSMSSECMGCPSKSHCHGDEIKQRDITVINDTGAEVNNAVVYEADTWKMILSAALIWILPVISMIVGYLVADRFAGGVVPILAAFLFLGCSFILLRAIDRLITGGRTFYPKITEVLPYPDYPGTAGHECR